MLYGKIESRDDTAKMSIACSRQRVKTRPRRRWCSSAALA